jgi:hypothetical protein
LRPQIGKKRQRRPSGVDEVVLSRYAKGLTTGRGPNTTELHPQLVERIAEAPLIHRGDLEHGCGPGAW